MADLLLRDVLVLPMDGPPEQPLGSVARQSVRIRDGRIAGLGDLAPEPGEEQFAGQGLVALPGFVQGHVHYCQTLFRGLADDLPLIDWLRRRIWPLEAAHDAASVQASARLSIAELLLGGTTTAQVMETVHHAEETFAVAAESGMVTILGNCLMDVDGPGVPRGWVLDRAAAMRAVRELHEAFDGRASRLHYAVSPRFILSCSDELAREASAYAREHDLRIHTHASEHRDEVQLVRESSGTEYILALRDQGLLTQRTSLAHCVHTSEAERQALVESGAAVQHCPSANLKLGSGLAPITEYQTLGLRVGIGADGAPCNNRLDALTEMRQAALLQAVVAGPGRWPAAQALRAATLGGAQALGLDDELGSISLGKRADLVLLDLGATAPHQGGSTLSQIVYAATAAQVRHVLVGGEWRVRDGGLVQWDQAAIHAEAERQLAALLSRAGLSR